MGLLNPIWLWGLLGLTIPVAIHLLSRKDMRIIRFGSLRHLEDTTTRQAIRIHLDDYLLLFLRCLIVALLAMVLAGLYFFSDDSTTRWLVVDGHARQNERWAPFIDSLESQGYEVRRLQHGFPLFSEKEARSSPPDYWLLAEQLSSLQLDHCIVISQDRLPGFAGTRSVRDASLTWLHASSDSARFVLAAVPAGDSLALRLGRTNDTHTLFETVRLPASQAQSIIREWSLPGESTQIEEVTGSRPLQPIRVILSGTNVGEHERRVVRAAIQAVGSNGLVPVELNEVSPRNIGEADWLIWLSADEPPSVSIQNVIQKLEDSISIGHLSEAPLLTPAPTGGPVTKTDSTAGVQARNCWFITRPLTPSNALRSQFTLQLATILLGNTSLQLHKTLARYDRRLLPETEIFTKDGGPMIRSGPPPMEKRSLGAVLGILLVALFALERHMANRQQL